MKKLYRIAITTGDSDGIGPEVTAKALSKLRPQKNVQFYLWRSHKFPKKYLSRIDRQFDRTTVRSWPEALKADADFHRTLIDIDSVLPPAKWVEMMGKAGASKGIDAIVTAPLSKSGIIQSGLKDMGHTNILKRVTKSPEVFMAFVGKKFNVVLLTGHTSIKRAYDQMTEERLERCITLLHKAKVILPARERSKPIALVGANPHAGEDGLIDDKENQVFSPVISKMKRKKIPLVGPLVPDVCFQEKYWKKHSFYLATYHDQGLIPFKMVHSGMSGVQISLGLPFVRTSVDHGTAKDIFGKDRADESSMKRAIEVAINLLKEKAVKW